MALPIKYTPLPSPAVATINYVDLAEGVTIFNAFTSEKSTGEQYGLTTSSPFSHLVSFSGSLSGSIAPLHFSGSFLTNELNRPLLLKGTAIVNITWRVTNSSGSNDNYLWSKLRKYDGSTYTEIAETSGSIITSLNGAIRTTALKITGIPATLIKSGEQINIQVGITASTVGSLPIGHIACDPQNRDDDYFTANNYDTTKLIIALPSKIN